MELLGQRSANCLCVLRAGSLTRNLSIRGQETLEECLSQQRRPETGSGMAEEERFGGPDVVVLPPLREKERRKEVSGSTSAAILHSQTAQLSSTYSRRDGGETQEGTTEQVGAATVSWQRCNLGRN